MASGSGRAATLSFVAKFFKKKDIETGSISEVPLLYMTCGPRCYLGLSAKWSTVSMTCGPRSSLASLAPCELLTHFCF